MTLIYSTNECFYRKENHRLEVKIDLWLPWRSGGKRREGSRDWEVGVKDVNYCSWNGFTMRSCCVALRTMSGYLHLNTTMGGKICIHVCVTWSPCCTEEKINKRKLFIFYIKFFHFVQRHVIPSPVL